jgi:hypothetical protein
MAVEAAQSSGSSSSSASFDSWYGSAKSQLLDLNASDDQIVKYIAKQFESAGKGGADSEAKRTALQQLVELRSRITTAMSNLLRTLQDAARTVIANMRA